MAGCLKPLPITSLKEYALTSALRDTRFNPIAECELPYLQCALNPDSSLAMRPAHPAPVSLPSAAHAPHPPYTRHGLAPDEL